MVVWLITPELPRSPRLLTVFLLSVLPALLILQARMEDEVVREMPRRAIYLSSSVALWVLAGVTFVAARDGGFTLEGLGLVMLPPGQLLLWSAGITLVALALVAAGRALRLRETPLLEHLLPRTPGEKAAFLGVSITAGVCEELVFRGFLIPALEVATGSLGLAVVLSCAVFGLLHSYQGMIGIVRTAVLGFVLAIPFLVTGSILPSMIAHAAFDVIAGIWLADWLLGERRAVAADPWSPGA